MGEAPLRFGLHLGKHHHPYAGPYEPACQHARPKAHPHLAVTPFATWSESGLITGTSVPSSVMV